MSDDLNLLPGKPTLERPLIGLTVLVVEDSRFAAEALRLLCLRSGARIRRADCLRSARKHLAVYRPSVAIVDLGLPDGRGEALIGELTGAPNPPLVLGSSGDTGAEARAMAAGADGFLPKPIASLAAFQQAILSRLRDPSRPSVCAVTPADSITPDQVALRDDLLHAAEILSEGRDAKTLDYAAQFLHGLALAANDSALGDAAMGLSNGKYASIGRLNQMVQSRIEQAPRL